MPISGTPGSLNSSLNSSAMPPAHLGLLGPLRLGPARPAPLRTICTLVSRLGTATLGAAALGAAALGAAALGAAALGAAEWRVGGVGSKSQAKITTK